MKDLYDPYYYTVSPIPPLRQEYIRNRLSRFINLYEIKNTDWPMDCVKLFRKMKDTQKIPFIYAFCDMPDKCDAITEYRKDHEVYITKINKKKVHYPFQTSYDRRLNFTLAHEIAHIALGHPLIPREAKTPEEIDMEEREADEFAGRLLMPEGIIYTCNYYSMAAVATYLNVSKTALLVRLNNLKRLNLPYAAKVPTCPICGNTHFSAMGEYCCICGECRRNEMKGIRRIYYPEDIRMDKYKRTIMCPQCHRDCSHVTGDSCSCGTSIFNLCSECNYANLGNARYCEICGQTTEYYAKGFLLPWQEALNEQKDAVMAVAEEYYGYMTRE
jgi:hypothetical protein